MLSKICHRINGAAVIGLALVALAAQPAPKTAELSLAKIDFISDVVWEGCRASAIKRIKARLF